MMLEADIINEVNLFVSAGLILPALPTTTVGSFISPPTVVASALMPFAIAARFSSPFRQIEAVAGAC